MKKTVKLIFTIFIILSLLAAFSLPCFADNNCTLTVNLKDSKNNPIDNSEVFICKIANLSNGKYSAAKDFENSGISVSGLINDPSAHNAETVLGFIRKNNIPCQSAVSVNGKAHFSSLSMGIWLAYCGENGKYSFNPYIVFLPYTADGKLYYELSSNPKVQINLPDNKSIYVIKKWEDDNNVKKMRPDSITVDLKLDGEVIHSAELTKAGGWSHTFTRLPEKGKYSVEEKQVKNYSAEYNGDAQNGFIITNTYIDEKLPQTGQLWWPVAVLCLAGIALIALGIIELGVRKNEKKK